MVAKTRRLSHHALRSSQNVTCGPAEKRNR